MKTAQEIVSQPAETATAKTNHKRGRPVQYAMPDPIPDTPENIMRALLSAPPRRENDWDYSRRSGRQTKRPQLIAMQCKTVALVRIVYKPPCQRARYVGARPQRSRNARPLATTGIRSPIERRRSMQYVSVTVLQRTGAVSSHWKFIFRSRSAPKSAYLAPTQDLVGDLGCQAAIILQFTLCIRGKAFGRTDFRRLPHFAADVQAASVRWLSPSTECRCFTRAPPASRDAGTIRRLTLSGCRAALTVGSFWPPSPPAWARPRAPRASLAQACNSGTVARLSAGSRRFR